MIYRPDTLNLFSDASTKSTGHGNKSLAVSYGSVAVTQDTIIDEIYRINTSSSVPAGELRGLRCSLELALKHRYEFPVINLFSDSLYSINALRDYINDWEWNSTDNYYTYNNLHYSHNKYIKNQNLIYECNMILQILRSTNIVNIFHQRGHINNNNIDMALKSFAVQNGIDHEVSPDIIQYISKYNNYIDNNSRLLLKKINIHDSSYCDPIMFIPRPDIY